MLAGPAEPGLGTELRPVNVRHRRRIIGTAEQETPMTETTRTAVFPESWLGLWRIARVLPADQISELA